MLDTAKLKKIVGAGNVIEEAVKLDAYSRDISFVNAIKPRCVVIPKTKQAIQELVKFANETQTPLVPVSS